MAYLEMREESLLECDDIPLRYDTVANWRHGYVSFEGSEMPDRFFENFNPFIHHLSHYLLKSNQPKFRPPHSIMKTI